MALINLEHLKETFFSSKLQIPIPKLSVNWLNHMLPIENEIQGDPQMEWQESGPVTMPLC